MSHKPNKATRRFHAHASARSEALNGLVLANFWQRLLGYCVDLVLAVLIWFPIELAWRVFLRHETEVHLVWDFHEIGNIVVVVLYWGLTVYFGNGQSPGKWVARTRIVSLTGERMGLWQSIERGLGYGAAVLEGGLGFLQFFWDRNRMCAQDRLAETIVVDVRKRREQQADSTLSPPPPDLPIQEPVPLQPVGDPGQSEI
jgi:uncharacterized RDD family membrane protein YckC